MPQVQRANSLSSTTPFARTIDNNRVATFAGLHWLALAFDDFKRAPLLSIAFGVIFALVPFFILQAVFSSGNHLIILPATIAFSLIGPAFAMSLYDVAWQLEKGHKPSFRHSLNSLRRNPAGSWAFALTLLLFMMAWTRIAALIHALYPNMANPQLVDLMPFLTIGTLIGTGLLLLVFTLSAFTPQILIERRVDFMTAIFTSIKAVKDNISAMLVWGILVLILVALSIITMGIGFIITFPLLSYASWHAYIAVIKTKRQRNYE